MEKNKVALKISFLLCVSTLALLLLHAGARVEALTAAQCKEERNILVNACKPVVARRPPSAYCCQRLRVTHVECVCPVITPKLAALIDVNYAIKVIQSCGRAVPRHYKCGSITTP